MFRVRDASRPTVSSRGRAPLWLRVTSLSLSAAILIAAGANAATPTPSPSVDEPDSEFLATAGPADLDASPEPDGTAERPEWFGLEMADATTGETFTIDEFEGQVVLLETMAVWCPTCKKQADEMARLLELLGYPEDLVSVSLDVDMGEDEDLLRRYAEKYGYDWRFAVAPLLVARALGNEYSAQYLNPPLAPMLVIDREGNVLGLPFGGVKSAESLRGVVEPLLEG